MKLLTVLPTLVLSGVTCTQPPAQTPELSSSVEWKRLLLCQMKTSAADSLTDGKAEIMHLSNSQGDVASRTALTTKLASLRCSLPTLNQVLCTYLEEKQAIVDIIYCRGQKSLKISTHAVRVKYLVSARCWWPFRICSAP